MTYEAVIGLEVHVQLRTQSKMFCSCPNRYGAEPNTLICPVCMGYPGALPYANAEAIERIIRAGLMCDCDINLYSKFDRKSYFYPDMPKNYQITQMDIPFCLNGGVRIAGKGFSGALLNTRMVKLTRIHMEEDVAKSTHIGKCSGIDFNRAGVPLIEIVSEPDMFSADEAHAYLTELKRLMQYAELSNCDMEKGEMRCDVNLSLRKVGTTALGTKVELKNLNSFRAVHRAIQHEIARQTVVLEEGGKLLQETRGWNDEKYDSYTMRTKEDAHDYRYFPDPDLPPIIFDEIYLEKLRKTLPELPHIKQERYIHELGLTPYDAETLTQDFKLSCYFEKATEKTKNYKLLANWIISELLRECSNAHVDIEACVYPPEYMAEIVNLIAKNTISGKIAKELFAESFNSKESPEAMVKREGLVQVSDEGIILQLCKDVVLACPNQVQQYKAGKTTVLQFLVGQVMKQSKGKANPAMVNKIFLDLL